MYSMHLQILSTSPPLTKKISDEDIITKSMLKNPAIEKAINQAAYEYAKTVGFRTYYLSTSSTQLIYDTNNPLLYYVYGCQGDGGAPQKTVAKNLNETMANDTTESVVFVTGDNLYAKGANSPSGKMYQILFDDVYLNPELTHSKNKKYFLVGGNHDANIQRPILTSGESGRSILLNEVAHTYAEQMKKFIRDGSAKTIKEALDKVKSIFENKISHETLDEIYLLNINDLLAWNMLSPAYSIVLGNVEFFCLDSNQLAEDIVDYLNATSSIENQVAGFIRAHKNAMDLNATDFKRVATGIIMHHLGKTPGKRAYSNDFTYYCQDKEKRLAIYETLGLDPDANHSNNEVIDIALQKLKQKLLQEEHDLKVNFIHGAHDHSMHHAQTHIENPEKNYFDVAYCFGGGGGELQPHRRYFGNQSNVGSFIPNAYGFGKVSIDQNTGSMLTSFYAADVEDNEQQIYQFHQDKPLEPIRHYPKNISDEEINQIKKLCNATKRALDQYFSFLNDKQEESPKDTFLNRNMSHRSEGVLRAHYLLNYISRLQADNYQITLNTIYESIYKIDSLIKDVVHQIKLFTNLENKHSLKEFLDKEFSKPLEKEGFNQSLESLWKFESYAFEKNSKMSLQEENIDGIHFSVFSSI